MIVEWQATRTAGGQRIDWRGVDKFRLRDGRIAEETVYMDTAALRAARGAGVARAAHPAGLNSAYRQCEGMADARGLACMLTA